MKRLGLYCVVSLCYNILQFMEDSNDFRRESKNY